MAEDQRHQAQLQKTTGVSQKPSGANGVLPLYAQHSSLCATLDCLPEGVLKGHQIIQIGHWCSCPFGPQDDAVIGNVSASADVQLFKNCKIVATELTPGALDRLLAVSARPAEGLYVPQRYSGVENYIWCPVTIFGPEVGRKRREKGSPSVEARYLEFGRLPRSSVTSFASTGLKAFGVHVWDPNLFVYRCTADPGGSALMAWHLLVPLEDTGVVFKGPIMKPSGISGSSTVFHRLRNSLQTVSWLPSELFALGLFMYAIEVNDRSYMPCIRYTEYIDYQSMPTGAQHVCNRCRSALDGTVGLDKGPDSDGCTEDSPDGGGPDSENNGGDDDATQPFDDDFPTPALNVAVEYPFSTDYIHLVDRYVDRWFDALANDMRGDQLACIIKDCSGVSTSSIARHLKFAANHWRALLDVDDFNDGSIDMIRAPELDDLKDSVKAVLLESFDALRVYRDSSASGAFFVYGLPVSSECFSVLRALGVAAACRCKNGHPVMSALRSPKPDWCVCDPTSCFLAALESSLRQADPADYLKRLASAVRVQIAAGAAAYAQT